MPPKQSLATYTEKIAYEIILTFVKNRKAAALFLPIITRALTIYINNVFVRYPEEFDWRLAKKSRRKKLNVKV